MKKFLSLFIFVTAFATEHEDLSLDFSIDSALKQVAEESCVWLDQISNGHLIETDENYPISTTDPTEYR